MIRKILGKLHKYAKLIIQGQSRKTLPFVSGDEVLKNKHHFISNADFVNELQKETVIQLNQHDLFPAENLTNLASESSKILITKKNGRIYHNDSKKYLKVLGDFIEQSRIPEEWKNGGLHFAGYIETKARWCLPSWVWTNASIVRYYFSIGENSKAIQLANKLLALQLQNGGWMVRYDFSDPEHSISPVVAPNDSAYIARKALLTAYEKTKNSNFLNAAIKCADWIINEGCIDDMPMIGFNPETQKWGENNIVDVGFTADLFCKLFEITGELKYKNFADYFIKRYVELFYIGEGKFATAINKNNQQLGGIFARGQAWALEGLIPYYEMTEDVKIKKIIEQVVDHLLQKQSGNGAWLYNLRSGFMGWATGYDNKGTPLLAHALQRCLDIIESEDRKKRIRIAIKKSVQWCKEHTYNVNGIGGMILSYNFEGAIVHSFYTKTAFVYSNCYLSEVIMNQERIEYDSN